MNLKYTDYELRGILIQYLMTNNPKYLQQLIEDESHTLYFRISMLLKKNGIKHETFNTETYPSFLFMSLYENRADLILLIESKVEDFAVISRLANLILKYLNNEIYRKTTIESKEIKSGEWIDEYPNKTNDESISFEKVNQKLHDLVNGEKSYLLRLVLELYFGIYRPYKIGVDAILEIVNIKRSTAFSKIRQVKEEMKRNYSDFLEL